MKSKWFHLKERAINLRLKGLSIVKIEGSLGIPRSTLSGWFKTVHLSEKHKKVLLLNKTLALKDARIKAAAWHTAQKNTRQLIAKSDAISTVKRLDLKNKDVAKFGASLLYFGEGTKREKGVAFANSDPRILLLFIHLLERGYSVNRHRFRCQLNLRYDQDQKTEITFWSKILGIPKDRFLGIYHDKRTVGRKTYDGYHGVCQLQYDNLAIQRELMYIYGAVCEENKGG